MRSIQDESHTGALRPLAEYFDVLLAELLVGFNLGAEVSQLTLVLSILGITALLMRTKLAPPRPIVVDLASTHLVGLGAFWFLTRRYA